MLGKLSANRMMWVSVVCKWILKLLRPFIFMSDLECTEYFPEAGVSVPK